MCTMATAGPCTYLATYSLPDTPSLETAVSVVPPGHGAGASRIFYSEPESELGCASGSGIDLKCRPESEPLEPDGFFPGPER